MFELPDMENVIKVTVDSASVKGRSDPIVTYGKKHQHLSHKLNLLLEITILITILVNNENFIR